MTKKISDNLWEDYRNHKTFKIDGKECCINGIGHDYSRRTLTVKFVEVMTYETEEEESGGIWKKMKNINST